MDFTFLLLCASVGCLLGSYFVAWHIENIINLHDAQLRSKINELRIHMRNLEDYTVKINAGLETFCKNIAESLEKRDINKEIEDELEEDSNTVQDVQPVQPTNDESIVIIKKAPRKVSKK